MNHRPRSGPRYTVVGHDGPRSLIGEIGNDSPPGSADFPCDYVVPGDSDYTLKGDLAVGQSGVRRPA